LGLFEGLARQHVKSIVLHTSITFVQIPFDLSTDWAQSVPIVAKDVIKIGVLVDRETDLDLRKWSKSEGRSKRRHCEVVLKKVVRIFAQNPDALKQLGVT
jgi:hypothetical protein